MHIRFSPPPGTDSAMLRQPPAPHPALLSRTVPASIDHFADVLGTDGIPRGTVMEIAGGAGCGKTALALALVAAAQQSGCIAAFLDAEHTLSPRAAQLLGVDLDSLLFGRPEEPETTLRLAVSLLETRSVDLLVLDSLAAVTPMFPPAGQPPSFPPHRFYFLLRKLAFTAQRTSSAVVFTNQTRERWEGVDAGAELSMGGLAPQLVSDFRIHLLSAAPAPDGTSICLCARIQKNRFHLPCRTNLYWLRLPVRERLA